MANRWGKMETVTDVIFLGSKITADGDCSHEIKWNWLIGRKVLTNLDSIKRHRHHLTDKGPFSQSYGFSRSHVWMWVLDHKEGWVAKSSCFLNVVLEMSLESPLDCTEIKPVNPKGNQLWIFIGRTDAEAPVLGPPDAKSPFFGKDLDARKDGGQEEKAMTEDEMVGWHPWLDGYEFEQALGDSTGQRSLLCCRPRGDRESDMTEQLNSNCSTWGRMSERHMCLSSLCVEPKGLIHKEASFWERRSGDPTLAHRKELIVAFPFRIIF